MEDAFSLRMCFGVVAVVGAVVMHDSPRLLIGLSTQPVCVCVIRKG